MLKDYQMQLLGFLEQLEMEISNLYKLFAEQFPGHQDLWAEMSREELQHAEYVRTLKAFALSGHVTFDEKMTKTYTIRSIIDDIRDKYKKTENHQYSVVNALSFSLSLEQSIIEHKFYNYFSSNDPGAVLLINNIREETSAHESQVKKALDEEKKRITVR
ncbi:MAG TPA: hypothetical protein PLD26_04005 [Smithella sp.]|jgi:hypothetical protein|nr:hypothetical protein [Smithella sp.]HPR16341.1 hypothetical protein [Smithella sp.]HPV50870.1 hypothetical protein [Smithella sp.]